jgi:hypothetical protein
MQTREKKKFMALSPCIVLPKPPLFGHFLSFSGSTQTAQPETG